MSRQKQNVSMDQFDPENDDFILWLNQFNRFKRMRKIENDDEALDSLIFYAGRKAAQYYDEIKWPDLPAGQSGFDRAVEFLKKKFVVDKNLLCERVKLYSCRQGVSESLDDFTSRLRKIISYCSYPLDFEDIALRDAFCVGLFSDDVRKAVFKSFLTETQKDTKKVFTFNDAYLSADLEKSSGVASQVIDHGHVASFSSESVSDKCK